MFLNVAGVVMILSKAHDYMNEAVPVPKKIKMSLPENSNCTHVSRKEVQNYVL